MRHTHFNTHVLNSYSIFRFILTSLLLTLFALSAQNAIAAVKMDKNFDHYTTNFPLDGAHKHVRCDDCHERGIFKGTPMKCESCHGQNSRIASTNMPANHMKTNGKACTDCHKNDNTWKVASFRHDGTITNCISCHNGVTAIGKNSRHIKVLTNDCEICHRQTKPTFRNVNKPMPHDGIVSTNCASCHNGQAPTAASMSRSRKINHMTDIIDLADCQKCHKAKYRNWSYNISFRHSSGVFTAGNCLNCHNSKEPAYHRRSISGSGECEACHKANDWSAKMKHSKALSGECGTCHFNSSNSRGGKKVTSSKLNHASVFSTYRDACDNCHTTSRFSPAKRTAHSDVDTAKCHICHGSGSQVSGGQKYPANHIANTGTTDCYACHRNKTGRGSWKSNLQFDHRYVSGSCSSCHKQGGKSSKFKSTKHFTTTWQCDVCHTTKSFSSFIYKHSGNFPSGRHDSYVRINTCRKCHLTNTGTDVGRGIGKNLMPDCAGCHANKFTPNDHPGNTFTTLRNCEGTCHKNKPEHNRNKNGW